MCVTVCIGSFTSMSAHPNLPALFLLFRAFGSEFCMGVNGLPHWGTDSLSRWMFQSMVATGVLPPKPPRRLTKPAQYFPDPGPAPDDRPKQKRKVVDPQRLLGVSQSIESLVQQGVVLIYIDGSSKRTGHRRIPRGGGGSIFRQRNSARKSLLQFR